jgi:hypothetical protein
MIITINGLNHFLINMRVNMIITINGLKYQKIDLLIMKCECEIIFFIVYYTCFK